ncbi:MAG: hypothetical protein ACI9VR_004893 [Cognaticolwellia sp.]
MLLFLLACDPFGPITVTPDPNPDRPSAGVIQANLSAVDFGERSVLLDGPTSRTLTLENVGELDRAAPLVWLISDPAIRLDAPTLVELGPGESVDLELVFAPDTEAESTAALAWPDGSLSLRGSSTAPLARMLPSRQDFGAVPVGCSDTTTVALLNDGSEALLVDAIRVDGGADFALLSLPSMEISPGNQASFELEFAPLTGGLRGTTLLLDSNDPANPTTAITFNAVGVDGIAVQEEFSYLPGATADILFVVDSGPDTAGDLLAAQIWTETLFERLDSGRVDWQATAVNGEDICHSTYDAYLSSDTYTAASAGPALALGLNPAGAGTPALLELASEALERSDPGECLAGFLRPEAHLHVVAISSRTEASSGSSAAWLTTLSSLTPSGQVVVSAVAGDGACPSSPKLQELSAATLGTYLDICAGDWDTFFSALAQVSVERSRPEIPLVLAHLPVPETLQVYSGTQRLTAWTWDAELAVLSVNGATEGLEIGADLRVSYTAAQNCD